MSETATPIYLPPAATQTMWAVARDFLPPLFGRGAPPAAKSASQGERQAPGEPLRAKSAGGVLVIALQGVLMRNPTWLDEWFFGSVVNLDRAKEIVNAAADASDVSGVLLQINSPGGSVDGSFQLSDAVHRLAMKKPTATHYENIGASGAFMVGAQTATSTAYRTTSIGSVGCYALLYDYHELFAKAGVEAVAITSGGMKGAALQGTEITEEQREYFRGLILKTKDQFVSDLVRGRKRDRKSVEAWADGRVHLADDAKTLGMIDHVEDFDGALDRLTKAVTKSTSGTVRSEARQYTFASAVEARAALEERTAPIVAEGKPMDWALYQVKQADAEFYSACFAAIDGEKETEPTKGASIMAEKSTTEIHAEAVREWDAAVKAKAETLRGDTRNAKRAVMTEQPDLHRRYLAACNPRQAAEISDKYR